MPLALAASALFVVTGAAAELRNEGGGDFAGVPMYRALNTGYAYDEATGDLLQEGLSYVNNVAPIPNSVETGRIDFDGASAWYTGSAQYSGFYASRSYASLTVANAQAEHAYYWVAGQGTTTTVQFFDPQAAATQAVFHWHVSGESSSASGTGAADGRIDFFATTETGHSWLDLFDSTDPLPGQLTAFGPGEYTYTLPVVPLGTPIYLYFWSSAYVLLQPGDLPQGGGTTITADYSRTVFLDSVELLDAAGQAVGDWSMVDELTGTTVFDETGRLVPVAPTAPIPEPGTWLMMLGGLASLGWARRRVGTRP